MGLAGVGGIALTLWNRAGFFGALICIGALGTACLPGGSSPPPEPTATLQAEVQVLRATSTSVSSPTPSATPLPIAAPVSTYIVRAGDYPTLIAQNADIPPEKRDAWVRELLALNGVEATSLQIGQKLILPPVDGSLAPVVVHPSSDAAPPASVLEPVATSTPLAAGTLFAGGVPFAATPPRIGFHTPTPEPTATSALPPTATATHTPAPTATAIPPGVRAWLTSSDEGVSYYYCDLDAGWHSIPPEKLQAFDSEQQLLAAHTLRIKAPDSVC
jgi:LysM repeat protein